MKLVINIPKGIYLLAKKIVKTSKKHNAITRAIANGITFEQMLDKAYEDFGELKAGDSYIIINGKEHITDVAYAMDGIELFINFIKDKEK